jgi:hypothetical protein
MYRNLAKTVVTISLLCSFLVLSGCMLLLGGAGGYFIAKGEGGGGSGGGTSAAEPKSKPTSQTNKPAVY